jgi:hypothetical protein
VPTKPQGRTARAEVAQRARRQHGAVDLGRPGDGEHGVLEVGFEWEHGVTVEGDVGAEQRSVHRTR